MSTRAKPRTQLLSWRIGAGSGASPRQLFARRGDERERLEDRFDRVARGLCDDFTSNVLTEEFRREWPRAAESVIRERVVCCQLNKQDHERYIRARYPEMPERLLPVYRAEVMCEVAPEYGAPRPSAVELKELYSHVDEYLSTFAQAEALARILAEPSETELKDLLFEMYRRRRPSRKFARVVLRGLLQAYAGGHVGYQETVETMRRCGTRMYWQDAYALYETFFGLVPLITPKTTLNRKKPPFPAWIKRLAVSLANTLESKNDRRWLLDEVLEETIRRIVSLGVCKRMATKTLHGWYLDHKKESGESQRHRGRPRS